MESMKLAEQMEEQVCLMRLIFNISKQKSPISHQRQSRELTMPKSRRKMEVPVSQICKHQRS
jgi:hypothetical protein